MKFQLGRNVWVIILVISLAPILLTICIKADVSLAQYYPPEVTAVRFDPSGRYLAIGHYNGLLRVWDRTKSRWLWRARGRYDTSISGLFFPENSRHLLVTYNMRSCIQIYDRESGEIVKNVFIKAKIDGRTMACDPHSVDPTGKFLALASVFSHDYSPFVVLVDLERVLAPQSVTQGNSLDLILSVYPPLMEKNMPLVGYLKYPSGSLGEELYSLEFCSSGDYLAGTTSAGALVVWKVESLWKSDRNTLKLETLEPRYILKLGHTFCPYRPVKMISCDHGGWLVTSGFEPKSGEIKLLQIATGVIRPAVLNDYVHINEKRWHILIAIDRRGQYVVTRDVTDYIFWKRQDKGLKPVGKVSYIGYGFQNGNQFSGLMCNTVDFAPNSRLVAVAMNWNVFVIDPETLMVMETIGRAPAEPLYPDLF